MICWDNYQGTGLTHGIAHYIPVYIRWFRDLELIDITENEINEMRANEILGLRDPIKDRPSTKTITQIFMQKFYELADQNYPIEDELKSLKIK